MKRINVMLAAVVMVAAVTKLAYSESLVEKDEKQFSKMYTGKYLYTDPDLSLGGGIKGEILTPMTNVIGVFALTPHEPKFVYRAVLTGKDNRTFDFNGLPSAKYDIFIAYETEVFEGLTLSPYKNTLTDADRNAIQFIVNKSDPFFEKKVIHRVCGTTGKKKGKARAIVSMIRLGPVTDMANNVYAGAHKRNYKMFYLEDVGPGYQVARTRDILSKFTEPGKDIPKWNYRPYLSGIRVTDKMKDLGKIDLSVEGEMPELPDPAAEIDPSDSVPVEADSK